jgi:hypothetical protein
MNLLKVTMKIEFMTDSTHFDPSVASLCVFCVWFFKEPPRYEDILSVCSNVVLCLMSVWAITHVRTSVRPNALRWKGNQRPLPEISVGGRRLSRNKITDVTGNRPPTVLFLPRLFSSHMATSHIRARDRISSLDVACSCAETFVN